MRTSAARTLHLALFVFGFILYVVFVLPRWWVLTGDIPRTLAIAGRIAAGVPIGLAALPVMQILQNGLRAKPRPPELALRLRAWSAVLHVVAGVLILVAAIAEIWLRLEVGAPWLFGVYGAAGAIAVLGLLALYLSFVAEKAPAAPRAKEPKAPKAAKPKKPQKVRADAKKKPATKRGRVAGKPGGKPARKRPAMRTEQDEAAVVATDVVASDAVPTDAESSEAVIVSESAPDTEAVIVSEPAVESAVESESDRPAAALQNKRPSGKSRHRMRR